MFRTLLSRSVSRRLGLETLEDRCTPAAVTATLTDGTLLVTGTTGADNLTLTSVVRGAVTPDGAVTLAPYVQVRSGTSQVVGSFLASRVTRIEIDSGAGNDILNLSALNVPSVIRSGSGDDTIRGSQAKDIIFSGSGVDTVYGNGGDDYLDLGTGADKGYGGQGNDQLFGDYDNDHLYGEQGLDRLVGGPGNDRLDGGIENDKLDGSGGSDTLIGGTGFDHLYDQNGTVFTDSVGGAQIIHNHLARIDLSMTSDLRTTARFAWAMSPDSTLSRTSVLKLLREARADNVLQSNELADLRVLDRDIAMPGYVRDLLHKSVYIEADAANQRFQGGAMGTLTPGTSGAVTLGRLMDKWFLGLDRPVNGPNATYTLVEGALFQDGVSALDVQQGQLGTCYFLATLATLADKQPNVIRNLFIDNGDGTFTVRFVRSGMATYVTVDRFLPTDADGLLVFAGFGSHHDTAANELWVALAEKAYAQLNESGWIGQDGTNSYQGIDGGFSANAMTHLTGRSTYTHWSPGTLFVAAEWIRDALENNEGVTAGGYGHAYAVLAVFQRNGEWRVRLFNPWKQDVLLTGDGEVEVQTGLQDGSIEISWDLFVRTMDKICRVTKA